MRKISVRTFALASVLAFLIAQINIYFAWTSHVGAPLTAGARGLFSNSGGPLRSFLVNEVNDFVGLQFKIPGVSSYFTNLASKSTFNGGGGNFFGGGGFFGDGAGPISSAVGDGGFAGGGHFGNGFGGGGGAPAFFGGAASSVPMKYFIDAEVIVFTMGVFVISLLLFHRKGIGVALLRAFEITALTILPLGIEIFFFDGPEFNVHASDIQVLAGAAWFTNADVLFLSSAVLGAALLFELRRYADRKSNPGSHFPIAD